MHIQDLCYLQSVEEEELIVGSFGLSASSEAVASGSDDYTSASSSVVAFRGNDSQIFATSVATAVGENPITNVAVTRIHPIDRIVKFRKTTVIRSIPLIPIDLFSLWTQEY